METTNPIPPTNHNNSSSRRKQSKPNRLEHSTIDSSEHDLSLHCENGSITSPIDQTILDFSLKTNENLGDSMKKSRTLKRKHPNQIHEEKIFHPDAFCNICQKEFCNKYFLKTHLANKHGIFDQESSNPSPLLTTLSSLIQSDDNDINNNNQIAHLSEQEEEEDGDEQDGTGAIHSIEQHEQISNSSINNKLLEDFCDICQKHFCNKYYLRKHKLDVHGVQTDCNIKSYKSKSSSSPLNLNLLLNPIFTNDSISQRRYTDSSNDSSILSKSSYALSDAHIVNQQISPCHLCGKKFQSNEYLQLHLMNKHQISNLIQLDSNEKHNSNSSPTPSIVETYLTTKVADRVSCDICHKQVCNKYFLKTHKFKVHGIGTDPNVSLPLTTTDEEKSPEPIPSDTESNEQILCELCSKNFPSKFLLHIHLTNVHGIQSTTDNLSTKTSGKFKQTPQVQLRVTCQVCKKELCNKYFLRAHMRNVHNQILEENSLSMETTKKFENNSTEILSMQAFLVESDDQLYKDSFVPCMVYLPCRQRIHETIEISLRLQPIEKTD